ncbi:class I SAM-dependent methyltransferase [Reinekea thalattae]|nr:class I SAM-dependent methyltransferase [Reinekea thalattae]
MMAFELNGGVELEIQTRLRLYDFSTSEQVFFEWQAGLLGTLSNKRVLELGCGDGDLWRYLLPRWSRCDILLTDIDSRILDVAQRNVSSVAQSDHHIRYQSLDFNRLSECSESGFDVIIANHNLFYADNLYRLLAEIAVSLNDGGVLICSTMGAKHLHELQSLLARYQPKMHWPTGHLASRFGLDNGYQALASLFGRVDQFEYDNYLNLPSAEPIRVYLQKRLHGADADWLAEHWPELESVIRQQIEQKGSYRLTPNAGFFIARKTSRP